MGVPLSPGLLSLLSLLASMVLVATVTAITGPVASFGGAGLELVPSRGWHWPDLRLSTDTSLPPNALRSFINSTFLATLGIDSGLTGNSPWVAIPDNYRDVAALGMSLCTRGDRVGCSPVVESLFMDYVVQRVVGYSVTGLGTDVDMEIGLYPAASLACVLRVKQWMAERPATGSNGGIAEDGQRIPTPQATTATGKALAARYSFLYRELMIQGWISWLRGPRPVPRPYPFPKVTNFKFT
jgi:hypothetical protein